MQRCCGSFSLPTATAVVIAVAANTTNTTTRTVPKIPTRWIMTPTTKRTRPTQATLTTTRSSTIATTRATTNRICRSFTGSAAVAAVNVADHKQHEQQRWVVEKITTRVFCPNEEGEDNLDNDNNNDNNNNNDDKEKAVEKHQQQQFRGGQAVTVFAAAPAATTTTTTNSPPWSASLRQYLAKSCTGPSVMVYPRNNNNSSSSSHDNHQDTTHSTLNGTDTTKNWCLSFYLPNGEETELTAHAAMAGAIRLAQNTEQETMLPYTIPTSSKSASFIWPEKDDEKSNPTTVTATTTVTTEEEEAKTNSAVVSAIVHEDDLVSLRIKNHNNVVFTQERLQGHYQGAAYRMLRTICNLQTIDLPAQLPSTVTEEEVDGHHTSGLPTFVRVSLRRQRRDHGDNDENDLAKQEEQDNDSSNGDGDDYYYTNVLLVYVKSVAALLDTCQAPSLRTTQDVLFYHRACQNIQISGLLLYTTHPEQDGTWLCRYFPQPPKPTSSSMTTMTNNNSNNNLVAEDAASGFAMTTLATAIQLGTHTEINLPYYRFQQGGGGGSGSIQRNGDDATNRGAAAASWIMVADIKVLQDLYPLNHPERLAYIKKLELQEQLKKQREDPQQQPQPPKQPHPLISSDDATTTTTTTTMAAMNDVATITQPVVELEEQDTVGEATPPPQQEDDNNDHAVLEGGMDDNEAYGIIDKAIAKISFTVTGKIVIDDIQEMEILLAQPPKDEKAGVEVEEFSTRYLDDDDDDDDDGELEEEDDDDGKNNYKENA